MAHIGTYVIYLVMACAVIGAIASLFNEEEGLGAEFLEGLRAIGHIFIPVAGIMASIPFLAALTKAAVGPLFGMIGADPAVAATTLIAVDMGGYQVADAIALTREGWLMAVIMGYLSGATIVFSIPVGLTMIDRKDHPYMALGIMWGVLSIPIAAAVTSVIVWLSKLPIRPSVSNTIAADYVNQLSLKIIALNLLPLTVFVVALALGLRFRPKLMIRGFMVFGRTTNILIRIVLVLSIVEYFTQVFSKTIGWGFNPIIADKADQFRALEIAGYIGIMLAGAFPMVYMLRKLLEKPIRVVGKRVGLSVIGAAGLVATIANILAMYRLVDQMPPRDKVLNIAFAVCAAFTFGDHLAFTANFQPTLVAPLVVGKLVGGAFAFFLAQRAKIPDLGAASVSS